VRKWFGMKGVLGRQRPWLRCRYGAQGTIAAAKQRGQDCGQHPKVQSRRQWSILNKGAPAEQQGRGETDGLGGKLLIVAARLAAPWPLNSTSRRSNGRREANADGP